LVSSSLFVARLFSGLVDGLRAVVVGLRTLVVEFFFSRASPVNNAFFPSYLSNKKSAKFLPPFKRKNGNAWKKEWRESCMA